MNIIGKIFVFAVFVMSLVFMSFAVAIYSTHTNWRDEITRTADQVQANKPLGWKAQLDQSKKERETLTQQIDQLTRQVAESEAERDQVVAKIQTALEQKDKELQDLRKSKDVREDEREKAQSELVTARAELEKTTKAVDELRAEVRGMQAKVDEQVDRATKFASELHEKESFLEIANERKRSSRSRWRMHGSCSSNMGLRSRACRVITCPRSTASFRPWPTTRSR